MQTRQGTPSTTKLSKGTKTDNAHEDILVTLEILRELCVLRGEYSLRAELELDLLHRLPPPFSPIQRKENQTILQKA